MPAKLASVLEIDIFTQSETKIRFIAAGVILVALFIANRWMPALNTSVAPTLNQSAAQARSLTPAAVHSSPTIQLSETPVRSPSTPSVTPTIITTTTAFTDITATLNPTKTAAPTESPSLTPSIPEEHYIDNVRGHKSFFPLGCETGVAVDWAAFFGITIVEYNFQYELPKSDNPDLGFVGDVRSPWGQVPPYGYGVHAAPIADLLHTKYGLPAKAVKHFTLEEVKSELASDQPIIAWVIGNMVGGVPVEFTDSQGNKTIVAAYEHVVLLTGYNQEKIRYNNNGKFYEAPYEVFLNSWGVLGNMAVIYGN